MWYYSSTKNKIIYQVRANTYDFWLSGQYEKSNILLSTPGALFPQKWCVAREFFVSISSQCSTQIWRMRYGGPWPIYLLVLTKRNCQVILIFFNWHDCYTNTIHILRTICRFPMHEQYLIQIIYFCNLTTLNNEESFFFLFKHVQIQKSETNYNFYLSKALVNEWQ